MVAIVVLATGALSILYVEGHLIATTGESLALAATDIADMLDRILFERYSDTLVLSQAAVFQGRDRKAMTELLGQLKQTYPVYLWLGVIDANGRVIAATNPASVGRDRGVRDRFTAVRKLGTVQVRDAEASEDTGGTLAVAFTAPVKSPTGEFLGVVTTYVGILPLVDIFEKVVRGFQAQRGSSGKIEYQFLTHDGDVIADSLLRQEGQVNLKRLALPSALLVGSARPGYVEERHLRRHVDVISGYAQTKGYGGFAGLRWGILMRMDRSDILTPMRKVLWKLTAAGALVMLPLLGFLLWTTGRLRTGWMHAKEAERALRQTQQKYQDHVNTIDGIVWEADAQSFQFTFVSQQAERLLGYPLNNWLGDPGFWEKHIHPEDREWVVAFCRKASQEKHHYVFEYRMIAADGRTVWLRDIVTAIVEKGRAVSLRGIMVDLTERKQAEEESKRAQTFITSIVENIPDMIFVKDAQTHKFVRFNKAGEGLLGFSRNDLIGKTDYDLFPKEEADFFWAKDREVLESGALLDIPEEPIETRDKGRRLLHTKKIPIRDQDGTPLYLLGISEDITERRRAEAALRESNERYRILYDDNPSMYFTVAATGTVLSVNQFGAQQLGYTKEELVGHSVLKVIHDGDHKLVMQHLSALTQNPAHVAHWEFRKVRKDGTVAWVKEIARAARDPEGNTVILIVCEDITERKKTEDALERLRRQNELILNSAGEGIYGLDLQGNATFVNPAAARMVGWEIEELLGKPMHALLHHSKSDGTPYQEEECPIYAAFKDGTIQYLDNEVFWKKDGTSFPVEYISTPLRERSKIVGAVVTFQDIAERKRAAEIRTRLLERVIAAQEEERRRIARELHDETGQSLTALLVGLRTMEGARTIKEAQAHAHELRRIAAQTLDEVGRLAKGLHPSVLDDLGLVAALERYAADFAKSYAIAIKVLTKGLEASRLPLAVETALYRIVQEALTNIAKHATAKTVEVSIDARPTCVWATVKDDGRGFDLEEARRTSGASAHLGIHGMQERAALLKGSIQIESLPRSGTTISVRIPLTGNTNG